MGLEAWRRGVFRALSLLLPAMGCALDSPRTFTDAGAPDAAVASDAAGAPHDAPVSSWTLLPQPTEGAFNVVRGIADALYIVGNKGAVLRSRDQGQSWESVGPGPAGGLDHPHLRAIAGVAEDDLWVGGVPASTDGVLFHSANGGASWQSWDSQALGLDQLVISGRDEVAALWAVDRNVVLAGGGGILARTDDGGITWTPLQLGALPGLAGLYLSELWGSSPTDIYAVGGITRVSKTSAEPTTSPDAATDADADGGTGDGAASDVDLESSGVVIHSSDGGLTWQVLVPATPCQLWHVNGTPDGAKVVASGACGSVALSEDHGASWKVRGIPLSWKSTQWNATQIGASWVSPSGRAFLSRDHAVYGDIDLEPWGTSFYDGSSGGEELPGRVTMSNGSTFTSFTSPSSLWGRNDNDVWAVGWSGFVWHRQ